MGISDILEKVVAVVSIVIFVFDLIAIGTGINVGTEGESPRTQAYGALMLILSIPYMIVAIIAGFVGLAKNITFPVTGIIGLVFSMFVWMMVGNLAPFSSSQSEAPIVSVARASLAFSILTGVLLLANGAMILFIQPGPTEHISPLEGHDYTDLDK